MPVTSGQPVVEVQDLSVHLDHEPVLRDVSFTVSRGEFVGIAGPNGGGKSTLLRALLGLVPRASGEVRLFGTPLRAFREHGRIGYVAQHAAHVDTAFPATAREVVAMGLLGLRRWPWQRPSGAPGRGRRGAVLDEALRAVGVEHLARRRIGALSGGERQRVLLAKALVTKPDLVILDEPTTGVDPAARDQFAHLLLDLRSERGMTMLLVSHDTDMLHHAADRLLIIDRGLRGERAPEREKSELAAEGSHA